MGNEVSLLETMQYMRGQDAVRNVRFDAKEFERSITLIDQYFNDRLRAADEHGKKRILEQQHHATIGHPREVQEMKREIGQVIEDQRMQEISFPPMYENLVDALFHETWGLGALSVWYEQNRNINKCRVNGRNVWYRKIGERHRMHEQYRDFQGVDRLIKNLLRNDDQQILKRGREYAQLLMYDGTRVTISQPPLVSQPTVAFRRSTVKYMPLQEHAELQTIPIEGEPIYHMLARCGCKVILTGDPGTAKTTFLVSMFGETRSDKITITCEHNREMDLLKKFPDRDITEYEGDENNLATVVVPLTLRQDSRQYLMGETREVEAPALKEICTNTTGFVGSTMHESDSTNVPGTLARKELRQSEGMNYRISMAEFANKLDFVLVMAFGEDETVIRNEEISALELDPITLAVTSRRILWFDGERWRYSAGLDPRLASKMYRNDAEAFEKGMKALRELAAKYPIPDEECAITLSHAGIGG